MMKQYVPVAINAACLLSLILVLQACAPAQKSNELSVASAYEASGVLPAKPYTRTIFSTTNW